MKRVPLFGAGIVGKSRVVTAQRRLNVYYEIRKDGDKANIVIYGTPGLTLYKTLSSPDGPIRGMMASDTNLYVVGGSILYTIPFDGTAVTSQSGVITTRSGSVSMANNGTQLMIVDGAAGYINTNFNTTGGVLSLITDAQFPNGATTVAFLNGFFIVNKAGTGQFYISDSYDGTSWDGTMFATAEQHPDNLLAVDVQHGTLMLFGKYSVEFWQNIGALDFPFAPIISATQEFGIAAVFSRAYVNQTLIFLAQSLQGNYQVVQLQGYNAIPISDPDLENIINSLPIVNDAIALSYMVDGHFMYQITFPYAERSFLYDTSTQMWSEVQTGTSVTGRHIGQYSCFANGQVRVSDYSGAQIYTVSPTTYTDNGATIRRLIQTRHQFDQGNVSGVDEIFLDMETGVGISSGQGSDPEMMLEVSKDGGRTFGSYRTTKIGAMGQYKGPRAIWRRIGSGRDCVFQFSMTDPVKFVITYGAAVVRERLQ